MVCGPGVQATNDSSSNTASSKILPPVRASSDVVFPDGITFDREKYPVSPVPAGLPLDLALDGTE